MTELQGVHHEISEEARRAIQRARKILDMASQPPRDSDSPAQIRAKEAERTVAAEKFQAVLLEYNLSQAMVEQAGGETDGRREEAKLKAGMYEWQRNLWEAVAELNFCLYFCQDVWTEEEYTWRGWDGTRRRSTRYKRGKEHRVIGRVVNTQATINLCTYIEAAIEQAVREKLVEVVGSSDKAAITRMLFSRYAVSFREGAADDVIGRVNAQRAEVLREEHELAKDHDPSGLDMTRDNRERLELFAGVPVTVVRLALNMNQIEELQPPPNPAKLTDSRATTYVDQFGYESWEVDALEPTYIRDLIRDNIDRLRDEDLWERALAREVAGKEWLRTIQRPERPGDDNNEEKG